MEILFYYGLPLLVSFISLLVGFLVLTFFGIGFVGAIKVGLLDPITSRYGLVNIISRAITLLLCAIGLIIAFRAGQWNIGAEGQILIGATMATWVALFLMPDQSPLIIIPTMYILGFIGGGLWALIPGLLKAKFDANEVLTTMMMNYIAFGIVSYLIVGPWRGKHVYGYETTDVFPDNARLPVISRNIPIPYTSLIIALVSSVVVYYMLYRTKFGLELRTIGSNPSAAKACGIPYERTVVLSMLLSGGFAGLAGVNEVAGLHYQLRFPPTQISGGYGFVSILVAFISRLNPLGAIFASILVGFIIISGYYIQISFGTRRLIIDMFTGLILMSIVSMELLYRYRIEIRIYVKNEWLRRAIERIKGVKRWLFRWLRH